MRPASKVRREDAPGVQGNGTRGAFCPLFCARRPRFWDDSNSAALPEGRSLEVWYRRGPSGVRNGFFEVVGTGEALLVYEKVSVRMSGSGRRSFASLRMTTGSFRMTTGSFRMTTGPFRLTGKGRFGGILKKL